MPESMSDLEAETPLQRRAALAEPLQRYRRMVEIRRTEDSIKELFAAGLVSGSTHTCQGQEAVSVGIAAVARPSDQLVCTYRGHGHAMALGMRPEQVLAEILGRTGGCVGGIGGSMHLSSREIGLMPTMAIVGAGIPIAAGAAWAAQVAGDGGIAIGLFGDGASNIGAFHEGLNLAAVWSLPVVFVCENNLYGEYSRIDATTAIDDIARRADSYGMPGEVVDGQDLDTVVAAMTQATERARSGSGPTLLEMKTYRYSGHSRSDPATYRPAGELDAWLARDPIAIYGDRLVTGGHADEDTLEKLRQAVAEEVETALQTARSSPEPDVREMFRHVLAGTA
ncbi:thiamine pyrophosphate-dependent dehydrogenase E1 component subunit alpha [Pseudonocardia sp. GCM10023141]|uniref:thiamine pyrophosphate-dependent dehydrogenase E1 component subunit alpha n=1 Tax=Pseudonocardia sp. GCM10023141 TaxID=3252653 RepID=UPI00360A32E4